MPISTHGVPPMRSSVENMKPCSLPSMRAVVASTQSSFAFEIAPISKAPPMDPISSRSPSVNALASLVTTETAMSPLLDHGLGIHSATGIGRFHNGAANIPGRTRLREQHRLVPEGHSELADGAVDVNPEVVGEAQHLA